jgi:hypothetical protein
MGDKLPDYKKAKGSSGVKGSGSPKVRKSADGAVAPWHGVADSRPGPGDQNQSAKK